MKITFKLYASLSDYLPAEARNTNTLDLELPPGTSVADVVERYNLPRKLCHLVLVDGHFIPPDARMQRQLEEGETLAIWPPIAGG